MYTVNECIQAINVYKQLMDTRNKCIQSINGYKQ